MDRLLDRLGLGDDDHHQHRQQHHWQPERPFEQKMQAVKQVQNLLGGHLKPGNDATEQTPTKNSLSSPFEPGELLTLIGVAHEIDMKADKEADPRITLNLSASDDGEGAANIPLHVSIRFRHKEIVLNTKQGDDWGKEEKLKLPFELGQQLDLRIRAHGDKFEIYTNGKLAGSYEHRVPLSHVTHVWVSGCMNIAQLFVGGGFCPVPYTNPLAPFSAGRKCHIIGKAHKDAKRFEINFKNGDDIAVHFNPRFDNKEVVRNACTGGNWGVEEKEGDFVFTKGNLYDVCFDNNAHSVKVWVDGKLYCTFAHRIDSSEINSLTVAGDTDLLSIHYE